MHNIILYTTDGKSALKVGAGHFNKIAGEAYSALREEDKERLTTQCVGEDLVLSRKDIKKAGKKDFSKN